MKPLGERQESKDILRALMDPSHDDVVAWSASDLRAILAHQLGTPLREEVDQLAEAGACTRESVVAAIQASGCRTFGELLQLEAPHLEMLRLVKDYAKAAIATRGSHLPGDVARLLYVLSILRGRAVGASEMTTLTEESIEREARRCLTYRWLPQDVRQWIRDGLR